MVFYSLLIGTLFYYLVLWLLQIKQRATISLNARHIIGPTKSLEEVVNHPSDIFGATLEYQTVTEKAVIDTIPTSKVEGVEIIAPSKKPSSTQETNFTNTLLTAKEKEVPLQKTIRPIGSSLNQESLLTIPIEEDPLEAVKDLTTKQELLAIADELENKGTITFNTLDFGNEEILETAGILNDVTSLFEKDIQEIIDFNKNYRTK